MDLEEEQAETENWKIVLSEGYPTANMPWSDLFEFS